MGRFAAEPVDAINTLDNHGFLVLRVLRDLAGVAVTVEVAGDGEQALRRLARFEPAGLPQLVLLDLKMPRMDGLELLGRIRADEATGRLPFEVQQLGDRWARAGA